jgi:hypothetical protein
MNKYNLRYLVWCIVAKYKDADIRQEYLGRRYAVNFGVNVKSDNVALIAQDIKNSLLSRGFVGETYLQGPKSTVYLYYNVVHRELTITIWRNK